MKVLLLFTLALHVRSTPTPDMKIIIHLHEGPGPGRGIGGQPLPESEGAGAENSCPCFNPFIGNPDDHKFPEYYGDPDDMCKYKRFCYVDCKHKSDNGKGRCSSRTACANHVFTKDVKCTSNGRKCWRKNKEGILEEIIEN